MKAGDKCYTARIGTVGKTKVLVEECVITQAGPKRVRVKFPWGGTGDFYPENVLLTPRAAVEDVILRAKRRLKEALREAKTAGDDVALLEAWLAEHREETP